MTLNAAHSNSDSDYLTNFEHDDEIENDEISHVPSISDYNDQDQQPVGNLFK